MAQIVADVMTRNPATIARQESVAEAARRMAANDPGTTLDRAVDET